MTEERVADAADSNWVDRRAPAGARPYLRLMRADRPIGTWLLLLPGWWSLALAVAVDRWRDYDPWLFAAFGVGAVAMRGAGCALNDIVDRDIDARVARTRSRPIPSGQLSVRRAAGFMIFLSFVGLAVLLTMNRTAVAFGAASLLPVAIYPFMKRVTWWPQLFLGIAFNWGALLGWVAHMGSLDWPPLILYAAGIFWTLAYDTIYAHQDKEDDALIGVRSTARLFQDRTRGWLIGFSAAATALIGLALAVGGVAWPAWIGLAGFAAHLGWQIARLDVDDPGVCLRLFRANRDAGLLLLAGLLVAGLVG